MYKICFITTIPLTLKSFVLETAKYLHEHTDWDISFICSPDDEFEKSLPEYIHFYPVSMKRGIDLSGVSAVFEMIKIFKRERFDLIQYSTPNAAFYASIAGWLSKVPVRLYCQWGMVYVGFSGIKRYLFKNIEKMVCFLSTWIEPDSYSNLHYSHIEKLYPSTKGSVVWNGSACGVNFEKFDNSKKEEYRIAVRNEIKCSSSQFVFGYVGRITRDKGVNELLSAFKRLTEKYNDISLLMVGGTENDSSIDSTLFEWAKNSKHVIFIGYTDVVEKYLSAMDIYVLPSYREGFGMGVVEAEAMGVPVIVTNIPGPIDAMKNEFTGLIVEKQNSKALYEIMESLYNDRARVESYGKQAPSFAYNAFEQKQLFSHILSDRKKLLNTLKDGN